MFQEAQKGYRIAGGCQNGNGTYQRACLHFKHNR